MEKTFNNTEKTLIVKKWSIFKIMRKMLNAENSTPKRTLHFENKSFIEDFERKEDTFKISWLGHSTLLMKIDDTFILTDPVWGKRVSPLKFAGPKRFFSPPVSIDDLPEIDAVIISHDHYDHLDKFTIKKLAHKKINKFLVPEGLADYLVKWGILREKIEEFGWWDTIEMANGIKITATPSKHFSGRSMLGRNTTLWSSWVIKNKDYSVFFSGDGGYSNNFKEIGDKLGPFDLVCMESGAYDELWPEIHMGTENAVKAFCDLRGKVFLPIHWGTFKLASHPWNEPVEVITKLSRGKFKTLTPEPGKVVSPNGKNEDPFWWRL